MLTIEKDQFSNKLLEEIDLLLVQQHDLRVRIGGGHGILEADSFFGGERRINVIKMYNNVMITTTTTCNFEAQRHNYIEHKLIVGRVSEGRRPARG